MPNPTYVRLDDNGLLYLLALLSYFSFSYRAL